MKLYLDDVRTLRDDTHEQIQDWIDGDLPMDEDHDNESWLAHGQDEFDNWVAYCSNRCLL